MKANWFRLLFLLTILLIFVGISVNSFFPDLVLAPQNKTLPRHEPGEDALRTYQGHFENIDPAVHYVGMEACAGCHAGIAETYYEHPMARSLIPISRLANSQSYDEPHHNPFKAFDSLFKIERKADRDGVIRVWHRQTRLDEKGQPLYEDESEVHYAIGSGNHGHSYLSLRGEGYLFQTPVSWFSQKNLWDLSPGFHPNQKRAITRECLFCHANRALPQGGYVNRYEPPIFSGHAIGCERCHGPGEIHVQRHGLKRVDENARAHLQKKVKRADFTIVNPGKLTPQLREAVCQQCHLEGEARIIRRGRGLYDFRPGLPLDLFWSIFVHARESGEDKKAVNHVEQMYLSRCFQQSTGDNKLGCISCHDPHQKVGPAERTAHYRERCFQCHAAGDRTETLPKSLRTSEVLALPCSLTLATRRQRNQDNCVACHMPPYASSDIVHAASTDHRIIRTSAKRRPEKAEAEHVNTAGDWRTPLVHFHRGKVGSADKELSRDLGIALSRFGSKQKNPVILRRGSDLLERALQEFPDDEDAWQERGVALFNQKRLWEAWAAFETPPSKQPRESHLAAAAAIAQLLGQGEASLALWRKAVAMNPWMFEYQDSLTRLLANKGAWDEVGIHCRQWLRLSPHSLEARQIWIEYLLRTDRREAARLELARLQSLVPDRREELNAWFQERIK
jgi:predicted CXXCH cytochrome family protein